MTGRRMNEKSCVLSMTGWLSESAERKALATGEWPPVLRRVVKPAVAGVIDEQVVVASEYLLIGVESIQNVAVRR